MEATSKKNLYEGMFLIDSALAAADWDGIISVITKILKRAEAEMISHELTLANLQGFQSGRLEYRRGATNGMVYLKLRGRSEASYPAEKTTNGWVFGKYRYPTGLEGTD